MTSGPVQQRRCSVFVSHAHDSEEHKTAVRGVCTALQEAGVEVHADYLYHSRVEWQSWVEDQILNSDYTIVVASPEYRMAADPRPAHRRNRRGARYEIGILGEELTDDRDFWLPRILPVVSCPGVRRTTSCGALSRRTCRNFSPPWGRPIACSRNPSPSNVPRPRLRRICASTGGRRCEPPGRARRASSALDGIERWARWPSSRGAP
ncbi:toll/interleukin-1 receptor domain-containing protein [Streptomyces yangpuensis]|uniref:toll/interleukin-1 receptor domain-containing protein n=1 Tax=Streptomyces yangpuensis TaxID=1648182 RepID=UPI00371F2DCD